MKVHIITPFPEMVNSIIESSILGKAHERGCIEYQVYNLFDFSGKSSNKRIDDYPFGGGSGMILKPEPIFEAFKFIEKGLHNTNSARVIYPTPDGKLLNQNLSYELSEIDEIIIDWNHKFF